MLSDILRDNRFLGVKKTLFRFSVLACCLLGAMSCGKKTKTKSVTGEPYQEPVQVNERFLEKQTVACESNSFCPNYIAKMVVTNGLDSYRYCTGFLTGDNTMVTSSSCLPSLMKREGQDCSRDIFIYFPKTYNREAERVGCQEVLKFSDLPGSDPNLWRDDVAFIKLNTSMSHRREAVISRDGISNLKLYTTWMVDQQGDYAALIKKSVCLAVHNNYMNPLASHVSSPNMLFSGCGLTLGSSGAPITDSFGRVRGVISKGVSKKLIDSIQSFGWLSEPLKEMTHASNFACAPSIFDDHLLDEKECLKEISEAAIAGKREQMTSFGFLFKDAKKKLKETLDNKSKYLNFDLTFTSNGNVQDVKVLPRCFKPLAEWLPSINSNRNNYVFGITLPEIQFKKVMDANGRVLGQIQEAPEKPYSVQFSLKQLKAAKRSFVWMWNSLDNLTFPNLSEQCSESLL